MSGTVKNSMRLSADLVREVEALRDGMPREEWDRLFRKAVGRLCEPGEMTVRDYAALKKRLR